VKCTAPIRLTPSGQSKSMLLPCGKCIQCRIQLRQQWVVRLTHELGYHKKSVFATLTYKPSCLPEDGTLVKRHLQLWFKRLRKAGKNIKYYACGEYGDGNNRPHYHAIIFGIGASQEDTRIMMDAWPMADWEVPIIRNKAFGMVTTDSIRYVAQYIDKKMMGQLAGYVEAITGRISPFALMSKGIGLQYMQDNKDQIINMQYCTLKGRKYSIPRYYCKKLNIDNDLLRDAVIDRERQKNQDIRGLYYTNDEIYEMGGLNGISKAIAISDTKHRRQRHLNVRSRLGLHARIIEVDGTPSTCQGRG
jgi:hypothetical protein